MLQQDKLPAYPELLGYLHPLTWTPDPRDHGVIQKIVVESIKPPAKHRHRIASWTQLLPFTTLALLFQGL